VEAGFKPKSNSTVGYTYAQTDGATFIQLPNGLVIYLLDLDTGYSFFAPPTVFNPDVVPNEQSFVLGHDSVRSAPTSNGVMRVSGDNTNQTTVEVYVGGERVKTIQWNGKLLARKKTAYGFLVASIS
ncbi:beta-galactosidase, partial [Cenococcum geophilum]